MQIVWHSYYSHIAVFVIEKAKIAKDILNKKTLIAGSAALVLYFL